MNKESKIFDEKLGELIRKLKEGLTEIELNSINEKMPSAVNQRKILHDKIRDNFLKDYNEVLVFLDNEANEKNVRDLSQIFDVLITYKKLFNRSHKGLEDVIDQVVCERKHLDDKT